MAAKDGLPDIADTQPDRLIKYRVSEDGFEAEVLLPGLWYTDFDKKIGGKLSYWSILKLHESLRWAGLKEGFAHYPAFSQMANYTLFVACASYRLHEKFHSIQYKSHFGKHFPLHAKLWIAHIGHSSFSATCEVCDMHGNILSEQVTKLVFIDKSTRKPTPVPVFMSEQFQKSRQPTPKNNIAKVRPPKIPSTSFELIFKVLHSDCDSNFHANQGNYLKWCSDAAAEAAKVGCFSYFKKHPELYPLTFSEMHYLGEALVNSEVTANVWEDDKDPRCLRATVSNKGKLIFHTVLEYCDGPRVLVEPHLESKL